VGGEGNEKATKERDRLLLSLETLQALPFIYALALHPLQEKIGGLVFANLSELLYMSPSTENSYNER